MASINLKHTSGNGTILNSPAANPSSDITLKLPSTTGSAGQVLKVASANHSSTNAELEFAAEGASGKILQVVSTTQTSVSSVSVATTAFGDLGPTVSITPASSSNKILITSAFVVSSSTSNLNVDYRLIANSSLITASYGDASGSRKQATGTMEHNQSEACSLLSVNFLHSPNTTSAVTYSFQVSHNSSSTRTIYLNRSGDDSNNAKMGRYASTITVMEVAA